MDYLKFVEHHRATNADITIGCLPVDYERASDFGLMKIDDEGRIFVSACTPVPAHSPDSCWKRTERFSVIACAWSCKKSVCWPGHGLTALQMAWQDFAEKPKGGALEKMKVDTTVLGRAHEHSERHPMTVAPQMCLYVYRPSCQLSNMSQRETPFVLPLLRSAKVTLTSAS